MPNYLRNTHVILLLPSPGCGAAVKRSTSKLSKKRAADQGTHQNFLWNIEPPRRPIIMPRLHHLDISKSLATVARPCICSAQVTQDSPLDFWLSSPLVGLTSSSTGASTACCIDGFPSTFIALCHCHLKYCLDYMLIVVPGLYHPIKRECNTLKNKTTPVCVYPRNPQKKDGVTHQNFLGKASAFASMQFLCVCLVIKRPHLVTIVR